MARPLHITPITCFSLIDGLDVTSRDYGDGTITVDITWTDTLTLPVGESVGFDRDIPNDVLGRLGEIAAAGWLIHNGWEIIERNYRWRTGELDIIACQGLDLAAAVEVKTRRTASCGTGAEAITPRKRKQLVNGFAHWLVTKTCYYQEIRVDAYEVTLSDRHINPQTKSSTCTFVLTAYEGI